MAGGQLLTTLAPFVVPDNKRLEPDVRDLFVAVCRNDLFEYAIVIAARSV